MELLNNLAPKSIAMFTQVVLPGGFRNNILGSKLRSTNIAEPSSISSEDFFLKQKLNIRENLQNNSCQDSRDVSRVCSSCHGNFIRMAEIGSVK